MRWKTAEAKQRLSEVVRAAAKGPQLIYSRERLVAAVLSPEDFREFQNWKDSRQRYSLNEAFRELRQICAEEGYVLETPRRLDRANDFADALERLPD
jgi:prevent-host-death family protein